MSSKVSRRRFIYATAGIAAAAAAGYAAYIYLGTTQKKEAVKIGVLADFSGPIAVLGEALKIGVEVAKEELEKKGGILGRPIELIYGDDKNQATEGVNAMTRLVNEGVVAAVGGLSTIVVLPVQEVVADNKLPFLSTYVSSYSLVDNVEKNYNRYKYYFHTGIGTTPHYSELVVEALKFIREKTSWNNVSILTSDQLYAKQITEGIKRINSELKEPFKIVYESIFPIGTKDFSVELSKAASAATQMLMFNNHIVAENVTILKQWSTLKPPYIIGFGDWVGSDTDYPKWTEGACHSEILVGDYNYNSNMTRKTPEVRDAILSKAGGRLPRGSFEGYDTFMVLAAAIEKAGSTKAEDIVKALEGIQVEGALGTYRYNQRHDVVREPPNFYPFVNQWQLAAYGYKDRLETVSPDRFKTAELILPSWIKL
ncbi:MAG: ABC transporter substrate-binding protein [Nitrososphaerales archaeon]